MNTDRQSIINAILDAAARPCPEIVESVQLLCSDGQYRHAMGIPHGVSVVKPYETRIAGYVYRDRNGTTFGVRAKTRQELLDRHDSYEAKNRETFRLELEKMPAKRLEAQADYWLKTAKA